MVEENYFYRPTPSFYIVKILLKSYFNYLLKRVNQKMDKLQIMNNKNLIINCKVRTYYNKLKEFLGDI